MPERWIATVTLNRPERLNALSEPLVAELVAALTGLDDDEAVRCIVLTGSEKAFAAGADIGELANASAIDMLETRRRDRWADIRAVRTPVVAAVSGYCLGGGCELAMCCDLIVASETAQFGQPETALGLLPGAGGTQRLTHAVGKALAMDVILSGRRLTAQEALAAGTGRARRPGRDVARGGAGAWPRRSPREARSRTGSPRRPSTARTKAPLSLGLDYERRLLCPRARVRGREGGPERVSREAPPAFTGPLILHRHTG